MSQGFKPYLGKSCEMIMFRSLLTTLNVSGNYLGVAQLLPEIGLSCKRIDHRYVNFVQILDTHCSFS